MPDDGVRHSWTYGTDQDYTTGGHIKPRTLEYMTPRSALFSWWSILRFFLLGPFTGACVGFAQATAAVLCWIRAGEPDFYFRGWPGVQMSYFLLTVGGGIVGTAYGVALVVFERWSRRSVRLSIVLPVTIIIAFAAAIPIATYAFRSHTIGFVMLPELIAVGFGFVLSLVTASREA